MIISVVSSQLPFDRYDLWLMVDSSLNPGRTEIWIGHQVNKRGAHCRNIMIVGDCGADEKKWDDWHIPSVKHVFQVNQQTYEFVTDSVYGDLDRDGCPDVPVGRLAVRSTSQLKAQIHKILTYHY